MTKNYWELFGNGMSAVIRGMMRSNIVPVAQFVQYHRPENFTSFCVMPWTISLFTRTSHCTMVISIWIEYASSNLVHFRCLLRSLSYLCLDIKHCIFSLGPLPKILHESTFPMSATYHTTLSFLALFFLTLFGEGCKLYKARLYVILSLLCLLFLSLSLYFSLAHLEPIP